MWKRSKTYLVLLEKTHKKTVPTKQLKMIYQHSSVNFKILMKQMQLRNVRIQGRDVSEVKQKLVELSQQKKTVSLQKWRLKRNTSKSGYHRKHVEDIRSEKSNRKGKNHQWQKQMSGRRDPTYNSSCQRKPKQCNSTNT